MQCVQNSDFVQFLWIHFNTHLKLFHISTNTQTFTFCMPKVSHVHVHSMMIRYGFWALVASYHWIVCIAIGFLEKTFIFHSMRFNFVFAVDVESRPCFNVIVIVPMHLPSFKTILFTLFSYLLYLHLMDYEYRFVIVVEFPNALLRGSIAQTFISIWCWLCCFTTLLFILLKCTKNRQPRHFFGHKLNAFLQLWKS